MPQKTRIDVEKANEDANFRRWRLLIRNPEFIDELHTGWEKWFLVRGRQKRIEDEGETKNLRSELHRYLGEAIDYDKRLANRWRLSTIPQAVTYYFAVDYKPSGSLTSLLEKIYNMQDGTEKSINFPPVEVTNDRYFPIVDLRLDLTNPKYLVLANIEACLSKLYKLHEGENAKRTRRDSLDFELKAFDLVQYKGTDFKTVARELHKPVSTIRSAYLSACQKIGNIDIPKKKRGKPEIHPGPISRCTNLSCRSAQKPEDFCPAHRVWMEQDQSYSRESLVSDISAIEHVKARP